MHICIASEGYPSPNNQSFVFVEQLCNAFAQKGINVSVIAPQSISKQFINKKKLLPKVSTTYISGNANVTVYRPYYFSFSNLRPPLYTLAEKLRRRAFKKGFHSLEGKPDICYGHFWHSGYAVFNVAKRYNLPLFIASGESEIQLHKNYSEYQLKEFSEYVSGVICVSTKNKEESLKHGLTTDEKCIVIPNAVDKTRFYKKNKIELRKKFGFCYNDFIVAFVGGFIHRKGSKRVADAITALNNKSIKSIFIGGGIKQSESLPDCEGIIFQGILPHDKIVDYLNCADVFVLPTLNEGSNNAIIEAMACGLPVISSDLSFNYDTLDSAYSILLNPLSIHEISKAIKYLKDNPEIRKEMGEKAVIASKNFDIQERAKKIINFINQKI